MYMYNIIYIYQIYMYLEPPPFLDPQVRGAVISLKGSTHVT